MKLKAEKGVRLLLGGIPRVDLWMVASEGGQKGLYVWVKRGIRGNLSKLIIPTGETAIFAKGRVDPHDLAEVEVKGVSMASSAIAEILPPEFVRVTRVVAHEDGTWGLAEVLIGEELELV